MITPIHINAELATVSLSSQKEITTVSLFGFSQSSLSPALKVLLLNKLSQS